MSVLNRAMFNKNMPVVRRAIGSNQLGEVRDRISADEQRKFLDRRQQLIEQRNQPGAIESFFTNLASNLRDTSKAVGGLFNTDTPVSDDSTVYDFGEYGGTYDLKDQGFQRVLRNYLPEGAELFVGDPNKFLLSPEGQQAIELFRADILKTQEANRAMGSPITGEGINGLKKLDEMRFRQMGSPMQGEIAQQAMMPQQNPENVGIMQGFEEDAKTIVDAGSEKKEEFDKAEDYEQLMNTIRGDKKSEDQRRDELAEIVGEKDANDTPDSVLTLVQPVIQMLDTPEVRQEGIGATPQAFAMGGPVYRNQGTNKPEGETSTNDDALNVALMSLLLNQNQGANIPSLATGFQKNLPVMQAILGRDPDRTLADTFFNISRSGFGLAAGMTPQEALLLGLEGQQKIGAKEEARDLAIRQAALGEASKDKAFAQQLDLAIKKEQAKRKDTKGTTFVVGSGVEVPSAVSSLLSDTQISAYPEGTNIFVDKDNKLSINIPTQADQEAYYNTETNTVVFLTDKEFNDLSDANKQNYTTVGAGSTFTKLAKLKDDGSVDLTTVVDIRNSDQAKIQELLESDPPYTIISNSFEVNPDRSGVGIFNRAEGGPVFRQAGSNKDGETAQPNYEEILKSAEAALAEGQLFPAQSESDRSFFNSLYSSTFDSLKDLLELKQLIAADPSLVGYTGLAQESLTKLATLANDIDNIFGDKFFPDDEQGVPKGIGMFTKPQIRELKSKVAELSDAVADIMSLRGKRGTPEGVRRRAEERTDVTGLYGSDFAFGKIDALTDYLTDRIKVFAVLSGNFSDETDFADFGKSIDILNNSIKDLNPNTFKDKKSKYTLDELEAILGE